MDTKLKCDKSIDRLPTWTMKLREDQIKRLQVEHGYQRSDAAKIYEYQVQKGGQLAFCILLGAAAARKALPLCREARLNHPLFRKTWMRFPIQGAAFAGAFYCASQLHTRIFPKFSRKRIDREVSGAGHQGDHDLVSRFRLFEDAPASADAKGSLEQYCDQYASGPLTRAEMLNRLSEGLSVDAKFSDKWKVKRAGKDKDDLFWMFGKIHGLENIAFATKEEVAACEGDPLALQRLMDKINDSPKPQGPNNFDSLVQEFHQNLENYKKSIEDLEKKTGQVFTTSDKKKLLALPFYLMKRTELPEPKYGQKEYKLFYNLTGKCFDQMDDVKFDKEEKITEFNYEKYIPPHLFSDIDTSSDDFKMIIKQMNFFSTTQYEEHCDNRDSFKKIMPILSTLTEEETEIFIHLLKSRGRSLNDHENRTNALIDEACSDELKEKLAKLHEEEYFLYKNRFMFDKQVMNYADKSKMPIDNRKIKEVLRNSHIMKGRLTNEIDTYFDYQNNSQWENGILTYVTETAWGDMRDLLKDIGIHKHNIPFMNTADVEKKKEQFLNENDYQQHKYFKAARFIALDMTDYEYDFTSLKETKGWDTWPPNECYAKDTGRWPDTGMLPGVEEEETMKRNMTGSTHREMWEARLTPPEEEEDDDDEEEEDEDEEGEEKEEEDEVEPPTDYEFEDDSDEIPENVMSRGMDEENRLFMHGEILRHKYNEVELDSFMKLLNVKPIPQWQEFAPYHNQVGVRQYEDDHQEYDPYYHLVAEVERKAMERQQALDFRRGTEVKFVADKKKMPVFGSI